ncbi:MAG: M23 family metallopeptidase [Myxococcales bacterium]|nr:M23 family metallopeptidase [Myxococcales bacterium]
MTARARCLFGAVVAVCVLLAGMRADATTFRRPFDPDISLGYGFDNQPGGGCQDYDCGGKCYDGHKGSDFPLPFSTTVRAGANGTVEVTNDGCASEGFLGSVCGGGYGNYVRVGHADGKQTYYAHMKNGSIKVAQGQQINCGDMLGESASSGNSTGYHLHFEVRVGGIGDDPFTGKCGGPLSYWVVQGAYNGSPSTDCEQMCECKPGDKQTEGCGNCGQRERTCQGDCKWSGFSGCGGEGECAPNDGQTMKCGECGEQSHSCLNDCKWGELSACEGPDPNGGNDACDTGRAGICADGRVRCVGGDIQCLALVVDETCNEGGGGSTASGGFPIPGGEGGATLSRSPGSYEDRDNRRVYGVVCNLHAQRPPTGPGPETAAWIAMLLAAALVRRVVAER